MIIVSIIVFIAVLGGLVLIHEIGHFVAARLFKVGVEEFGIGFPPRAASIVRKGIIYSINWIPIGGFVKIKGVVGGDQMDSTNSDATPDTDTSDHFANHPWWQRFTIIAAGIVMNLVLAVALFSVGYMIGLPGATTDLPTGAIVSEQELTVAQIDPTAPAQTQGLQVGDQLVSINGVVVESVEDIRNTIGQTEVGALTTLQIERADSVVDLQITTTTLPTGESGIGAAFVETGIVRLPFFKAIAYGTTQTFQITGAILVAFGSLITGIFQGDSEVAKSVSGPLGIASLTHQVTQLGLPYVLQFAALLSINLAIFNLLPVPALDGGRLLFLFIEAILRRPVNVKTEAIVHNIGFILLLLLIVGVTIKDVFSLF